MRFYLLLLMFHIKYSCTLLVQHFKCFGRGYQNKSGCRKKVSLQFYHQISHNQHYHHHHHCYYLDNGQLRMQTSDVSFDKNSNTRISAENITVPLQFAENCSISVKGRPHTDASRAKISAANQGKIPWNVGKSHSLETRMKIAAKTREAMRRLKVTKATELGLTLEQYEKERLKARKEKKKTKKTGLTVDGRRRISENTKRRWQDPEFRRNYTIKAFGNRNHTEETRRKISESIKQKWKDNVYRNKFHSSPSEEVREKISNTLKIRWEDPEFRNRMLTVFSSRSVDWKDSISEKIKEKWNDPLYREAVISGLRRNSDFSLNGTYRSSRPSKRKHYNLILENAQKFVKLNGGLAGKKLKDLLGVEIWTKEKARRFLSNTDDDLVEAAIASEWISDYAEEYFLDDMDDVIEEYDETGQLVKIYSDKEFEKIRGSSSSR